MQHLVRLALAKAAILAVIVVITAAAKNAVGGNSGKTKIAATKMTAADVIVVADAIVIVATST